MGQKKLRNLSGPNKSLNLYGHKKKRNLLGQKKTHAKLGQKNQATSKDNKNHAIFLDIKILQPLGQKKSRLRETKHLLTDVDSSTDTTVGWTKNTQKPEFIKNGKIIKMEKFKNL